MNFLDPRYALDQFKIYGTQDVADFGVGAGHFALEAARRLDGGRLFAIDIEKEMLERLVSEARSQGRKNIHPIWGDLARVGGIPLADETIDSIIATNVLFQVDDRDSFVKEVKRILRPNGRILLVDWREDSELGPHQHHRISEDAVLKLFKHHGFNKTEDIDAGDYHYGMILKRS